MDIQGKHVVSLILALLGVVAIVAGALMWWLLDLPEGIAPSVLGSGALAIAVAVLLSSNLITNFVKTRQAGYAGESLVVTLGVIAIIVLANYVLYQDQFQKEWDVTAEKVNSLTPETLDVLANLPENVRAIGFFTSQSIGSRDRAEEQLKLFRANSDDKFNFVFLDPTLQPGAVQEYGVTTSGQVVLEMGTRREMVDFVSEQTLTAALYRLINLDPVSVYYTVGHQELSHEETGERGLSQIAQEMERLGYTVGTVNLIAEDVPEDASAVIVAGPQVPLGADEVQRLGTYLANGGSVIYLQEPAFLTLIEEDMGNPWADYLATEWGIALNNDIIVDRNWSYGDALWPLAFEYGSSPVTEDLTNYGLLTFYPQSGSITLAEAPEGVIVTPLVRTSPDAYGETNFVMIEEEQNSEFDEGVDFQGPLTIAVSAENSTTEARLIVVGDADFVANASLSTPQVFNKDILMGMVKWTVAQEASITITRDPAATRSLRVLSGLDQIMIGVTGVCMPVLLVIVAGIIVWWSRRERPAYEGG